MTEALTFRQMTRAEVDVLVSWAATEGWNPGLHDAANFWALDADAFIAAEMVGEMIGGGAITSYQGDFGFMGFFIVRPEYRGQGLGNQIWHARRERLIARLKPGATIGLDGVFTMQDYYAKGGFVFAHRNMRFEARIPAGPPPSPHRHVVPLGNVPFEALAAYDRTCFPAARRHFLRPWISQPDSLALGYWQGDELAGYGVIRRCGSGCKIGPLFANREDIAEALFTHLAAHAAGGPLYLDAPENNAAAIALVQRHQMMEVFGCARMYLGAVPAIAHDRIFGVTTFEVG